MLVAFNPSGPHQPGTFFNEQRAKQLISFKGLWGVFPRNGTPTDVDTFLELNWHFLFGEVKSMGVSVPTGQRLAFERLMLRLGDGSLFFVAEHNTPADQTILLATCQVVEWFSAKGWKRPSKPMTVKELCELWVIKAKTTAAPLPP